MDASAACLELAAFLSSCFVELVDLFFTQAAKVAGQHVAEQYRTVGNAFEFAHIDANGFEHAANLAVSTFANPNQEPGVPPGVGITGDLCGFGHKTVVEAHAFAQD